MRAPNDNTGLTRYSHAEGVSTVQVAARGETLQDAQAFALVARRDKDGKSRTMVDIRNGMDWVRVTVETSEIIRMASALAALLHSKADANEIAARANAYASSLMSSVTTGAQPSYVMDMLERAARLSFIAGYEAGRREG